MRSRLCQVILAKFTNTNHFCAQVKFFIFLQKKELDNSNETITLLRVYIQVACLQSIFFCLFYYCHPFHLLGWFSSQAVLSADIAASIGGCCWHRDGSQLPLIGQWWPALASDYLVGVCRPWLGDPSVSISHSTNTDSASVTQGPRLHQQFNSRRSNSHWSERAEYYTGVICNNKW